MSRKLHLLYAELGLRGLINIEVVQLVPIADPTFCKLQRCNQVLLNRYKYSSRLLQIRFHWLVKMF